MKYLRILLLPLIIALAGWIPASNGYKVGDTAMDFNLKNVDGKMVSLADFKSAKGFIVIFDCNTCPYSQAYNSRIIALSKKYADTYPVVAINPNSPDISPGDSYEKMVSYAKHKGYTFPYLVDETQEVAKTYGATNTPHVYVLTKVDGDLKVAYIGTIDNSPRNAAGATKHYVEDAINALLTGDQVKVTQTKAIGCGIKWER